MRACVIGGGLAGSLLAWRLARASGDWDIDLVLGTRGLADATAASGGAVRAYETHAEARLLAAASMMELLASQTLRQWADYRRLGSVYLFDGGPDDRAPDNSGPDNSGPESAGPENSTDRIQAALAEIEAMLPGSCRVASRAELEALGWDVPAGATAVLEHHAGYISPARLRDSVLADGALRRRVRVLAGAVRAITPRDDGAVRCDGAVRSDRAGTEVDARDYDVVVVAAGAWTGSLLLASGLPAGGYRTKSIQYSLYAAEGWRPPHFVDETTGLYGRPGANADLLLGLPTAEWDVDPDRPPTTPPLHERAAHLAQQRFPKLNLGPATRLVGSSDCYIDQPVLALRPVVHTEHRLFTFSGGAGGSVKTALAASHRAAIQLVESDPSPHHPSDREKVTP